MRILAISPWCPCPADNGSKTRVYQLTRALARRHDVDFVCFADGEPSLDLRALDCRETTALPRPAYARLARPSWRDIVSPLPRVIRAGHSKLLARCVESRLRTEAYDLLVAMTWSVGRYLVRDGLPRLLDQHNIESAILAQEWRAAAALSRPRRRLAYEKFRRYEGRLCAAFNACAVVSEPERARLLALEPRPVPHIGVVPNGVDTTAFEFQPDRPGAPTLLFTGPLTYPVNRDAVAFFAAEILPRVRSQVPAAQLLVTGDLGGLSRESITRQPGVRFLGRVDDIRQVLARSALAVAPLRFGGGTRLKILEAMASGLPVVATPLAADGLDARDGEHLLLRAKPQDFADAVLDLLRDRRRGAALALAARRLVVSCYDWRDIGRRFAALAEQTASEARR